MQFVKKLLYYFKKVLLYTIQKKSTRYLEYDSD